MRSSTPPRSYGATTDANPAAAAAALQAFKVSWSTAWRAIAAPAQTKLVAGPRVRRGP